MPKESRLIDKIKFSVDKIRAGVETGILFGEFLAVYSALASSSVIDTSFQKIKEKWYKMRGIEYFKTEEDDYF